MKRRKIYATFKGGIWASDLAEMWSLFSFNGGVIHLLNFVDVITKYEWVKPLKDKKAKTVSHCFWKTKRI